MTINLSKVLAAVALIGAAVVVFGGKVFGLDAATELGLSVGALALAVLVA